MMKRAFPLVLLLILGFWPKPAMAYIDPGTGSMVLQLTLAGLAAAATALRMFWHQLRHLFPSRRRRSAPALEEAD